RSLPQLVHEKGQAQLASASHGCTRSPTDMSRPPNALIGAACALALSACAVGPNYHRPAAPPSPTFKEAQGWTPAAPVQISPTEQWWTVYDDPVLSSLEQQV